MAPLTKKSSLTSCAMPPGSDLATVQYHHPHHQHRGHLATSPVHAWLAQCLCCRTVCRFLRVLLGDRQLRASSTVGGPSQSVPADAIKTTADVIGAAGAYPLRFAATARPAVGDAARTGEVDVAFTLTRPSFDWLFATETAALVAGLGPIKIGINLQHRKRVRQPFEPIGSEHYS